MKIEASRDRYLSVGHFGPICSLSNSSLMPSLTVQAAVYIAERFVLQETFLKLKIRGL